MIRRTVALACLSLAFFPAPARADAPLDFNRDVRPILSEACFQCHGPDTAKRKANLRLDTKHGGFVGLSRVPVVEPGKPDESELYLRVVSDDPDEKMPPPDRGEALTPAQIATLKRWIADGAEWAGHWAYVKPLASTPPVVEEPASGFVRSDVDRFLLATMRGKGLSPSPEAERATLIRRLSFDLRGLPPSPAEVDAFLGDGSTYAYDKLIDRLLASPQYGERMAAHWLDLVRYADTCGYHGDNHRDVALYRDYVIGAFNDNLPFDVFTVEQLAGDLLENAGERQRIASGYNKLLQTTQEGGAQAKEYVAKYAADRVRNASSVWMGSTLGCAECHDHKYDPFTTKDFYQFAAFFADIQEAAVGPPRPTRVPTPEQAEKLKAIDAAIAEAQKILDAPTPELASAQAAWEEQERTRSVSWKTLRPVEAKSAQGAALEVLDDGSIRAAGANPERDVYTIRVPAPAPGLTGLRLEVLPDGKFPALGPGRAANGNFVLNEVTLEVENQAVEWSGASATFSQAGYPVAHATDAKPSTGWAILPETGRPNLAVFEAKDDFGPCCEICPDNELVITLSFQYGGQHALGRFRLSVTGARRPLRADALPAAVAEALAMAPDSLDAKGKELLAAHYRSIAPALDATRSRLALIKKSRTDLEAEMPITLVTQAGTPRMMRVLPRGNWLDESGPVVNPALPGFLVPSPASGDAESRPRQTRLDLARWLVSPENPLTARVFVNRVWALAFGQGLVATPDDFGAQGAWPTHPELLDRLAADFVASGWDVKRLTRAIVTSGAYRQSSVASAERLRKDPYNQWLARQGRFRVDAETVRDTALSISGLLVERVGGPTARPYQPAGYWSHLNFPKREYQPDEGEGLYRRGIYTYWCRTFLHPSLLAFDAPTREECTSRRNRSNTPLQALVLLNDPTYVEAARALAERALREGGTSDADRVAWVYRTALSRAPRDEEARILAGLLERHRDEYRDDRASAQAFVKIGELPAPADLDVADLAAWTSAARVILNLHETITRN